MSRKSRYDNIEIENKEPVWIAGAYVRLSKEDLEMKNANSQSILIQKKIVSKYISEHPDIRIREFYVDDGYTGTDMDRPGFQLLKKAYESGLINCIIIKDLSRLARNNEESERLVKVIFPFFKIRFISVNDRIDSFLDPESIHNIATSFKNIVNDEYCHDLSNKVKHAFRIKYQKGEFTGSFAPYGYQKDPLDKHKLIIDNETAPIVRFIYNEFIAGTPINKIAQRLTDDGVLSPYQYKHSKGQRFYLKGGEKISYWSATTIRTLLMAEVYIGNMVQGRHCVISYKNHKKIEKNRGEWIRVEGTHEPIISKELFEKVQALIAEKHKPRTVKSHPNMWAGYVFCGKCGEALSTSGYKGENQYRGMYCMSNYKRHAKCTGVRIKISTINTVVLEILNHYLVICADIKEAIFQINSSMKRWQTISDTSKIASEIMTLETKKRELYTELKSGRIGIDDYKHLRSQIDNKIENLSEAMKHCNTNELHYYDIESNSFINQFLQHRRIMKMTKDLVVKFISKVIVYSKDNIEVVLNFSDEFDDAVQFIKSNQDKINVNFKILQVI